jgi:hypothetical protein
MQKINSRCTLGVFVFGTGIPRYSDTAASFTFVFSSMPRRFCDQQLLTHSWHTRQNGGGKKRNAEELQNNPNDSKYPKTSICYENLLQIIPVASATCQKKRTNLCTLYRCWYCHISGIYGIGQGPTNFPKIWVLERWHGGKYHAEDTQTSDPVPRICVPLVSDMVIVYACDSNAWRTSLISEILPS